MPEPLEANFLPDFTIKSVSDILTLIDPSSGYLDSILDDDPDARLGRSDSGIPRPFSNGLWFRGDHRIKSPLIPSAHKIFESPNPKMYDEKNAFLDLRLRMSGENSGGESSFDLLCQMRHYGLPARILDWSENPLTALFFGVSNVVQSDETGEYGFLTCLNAYRLNKISNIIDLGTAGLFYPESANVIIRALMAEHTKLIDVIDRTKRILRSNFSEYNKRVMKFAEELDGLEKLMELAENPNSVADITQILNRNEFRYREILKKLSYPIAVVPRRSNRRMAAQLASFTLHGGKRFGGLRNDAINEIVHEGGSLSDIKTQTEIFDPLSLDTLNTMQGQENKFLLHVLISAECMDSIARELDRLSINNASLFPEFDRQAEFVSRRWIS